MPSRSFSEFDILRKDDQKQIGIVRLSKRQKITVFKGFEELPFKQCEAEIKRLILDGDETGSFELGEEVRIIKV